MKNFCKIIVILIASLFFSCKQTPTDEWVLINDIESEISVTINGKIFDISAKSNLFVVFDEKPVVLIDENLHADYIFGSYYKGSSYNMIKFTPQPRYDYVVKNQTTVPILVNNLNAKNATLATIEPGAETTITVYKNQPNFSFVNENFAFPYLVSIVQGIYYISVYQ